MIALLTTLAFAHGGEEHAEPAAAAAAVPGEEHRITAASDTTEAVLRVAHGPVGEPARTTLLLADWATSAPIADATARLTLSGPATVALDFAQVAPGILTTDAVFPAAGDYAGALVVTATARSDLLAISGLAIGSEPDHDHGVAGLAGAICASIAGFALASTLAGAVGYAIGRRRGLAAAAALAVAAQVSAHGGEEHAGEGAPTAAPTAAGAIALPLESQFLLGLRTIVAASGPFRDQVQALGHFVARPGERATLTAPVSGLLLAPPDGFPAPGTRVEAGELLAEIRETPGRADRAALGQARSDASTQVAAARAALALAERDAAQADALGDAISARERLARQQAVTVARETLRQAQAARSATGAGALLPIRAPLAGTLGPTSARPGDQIEEGAPLFRVSDVSGLWVEARVPERLALGLVPGGPATITTAAAPGRTWSATVLDAGQEADPTTGMVVVTLSVASDEPDLRPGFGARAWIGVGDARDTLTVPDEAVIDSSGAALAFVKTGPERFELRELALGSRAGGAVEILSGLAPGDRVVTAGTYALRSLAGR